MQGIKQWAAKNPSRVTALLQLNPAYVFFRELPDSPLGPIGVTVETIKKLELAPEDQRKLFSGNAGKLLKMNF